MLAAFRAFAKSWVAKILFGLLIISFVAFFGMNDMVSLGSNNVIEAGPRKVSAAEFKTMFDNRKRMIEQQNGGRPVPMEELVKAGVPMRIADTLAGQTAMLAVFDRMGLKPADRLVVERVREIPDFFNQVTGAFDKTNYARVLGAQQLTPEMFEQDVRDQIAMQHFASGVDAGLKTPQMYGALQAAFGYQRRDVSWIAIGPAIAGMPPSPTDADLNKFIQENASRLRRPELRDFSLVLFEPAALASKVSVDEAQLRQQFEFRKDALSQPERRSFVQVSAPSAQAAAAVARGLQAGQDPAAVAKANKGQVVRYDDKPRTAVTDPKVAAAAFALQAGQVSAPIQGALGWQVVKMTAVTPGRVATFEEARPQLEAALRQRLAADKVEEAIQQFQDGRDRGLSFDKAAEAAGVTPVKVPGAPREAGGNEGRQRVLETVFTTAKGQTSELQDGGGGVYYAVEVTDVQPSALPKLDDRNRGPLTQIWRRQRAERMMQEKADALLARLRKGESLETVAASVGAPVQKAVNVERQPQNAQVESTMVAPLFQAAKGAAFSAPGQSGFIVGRVDAIHQPPTVLAANTAAALRPEVTRAMTNGLVQMLQSSARETVKVELDKAKVEAALGIAPEPTAPAGKKK